MILPKGITGFYDSKSGTEPPLVDLKQFKVDSHLVARQAASKLAAFRPGLEQVVPNFHSAVFAFENKVVTVLCNAFYPFLAFVNGNEIENFRLSFVEAYKLSSLYERLDYTVLSQDILTMQLDKCYVNQLDVAELKQLRSWKPQTIAEVIFNWWG